MFYLTQLSVDVLGYDIVCVDIVCVDNICVTDGMLHIQTIPLMWLQMYMNIIYDTVQPALMVSL